MTQMQQVVIRLTSHRTAVPISSALCMWKSNRHPEESTPRILNRVLVLAVSACMCASSAGAQDSSSPEIFLPGQPILAAKFPLLDPDDEPVGRRVPVPGSPETEADQNPDEAERDDQKLGQPPPDNSLQFLRGSTVLLKPGDVQTEYGFFYSLQQNRFFEPDGFGGLIQVESTNRSFVTPLTMRYGLSEDIQLTGTVPLGVAIVETEDPFFEDQSSLFGVGDIVLGANAVLGQGNDEAPDILGGVNFFLPTDNGRSGIGGLQPALGSGFFGVGWNLTAIRSYDPAVFFGSIGHTHLFERHLSGGEVQPGEFIDYSFGMSFAINDEVTLNGEVIGGFQFDTRFNDAEIPDSSNEPISLRLSVIRTVNPTYFIEPSLQFGLTDDASTVQLGVTFTRSCPSCGKGASCDSHGY